MLPVFRQRYLRHLFSQPAVLQVTSLLLNVAGVVHVVEATSAGYTKSALISTFRLLTLQTLPSIGPYGEQSQRRPGYTLHDDELTYK